MDEVDLENLKELPPPPPSKKKDQNDYVIIKCPKPTIRGGKCCFYFFCFLAFVLMVRASEMLKHGVIPTRTQLHQMPTPNQWNEHVKCLQDMNCDNCVSPIVSYIQPPSTNKLTALLAMYGTGGTYLRQATKSLLRMNTGMHDSCYLHLPNDCTSPYHFSHFAFTRFVTVSSLVSSPFEPEQIIHLTRNPLDAIVAAYHYYTQCLQGKWSNKLVCLGLKAHIVKDDVNFNRFAEAYAQEYDLQHKYVATFNTSITIYYEDLVSGDHPKTVLNDVFSLLNNKYLFSPERALRCALRPSSSSSPPFFRGDVFSPELLKRICVYLIRHWNQEKFGAPVCSITT